MEYLEASLVAVAISDGVISITPTSPNLDITPPDLEEILTEKLGCSELLLDYISTGQLQYLTGLIGCVMISPTLPDIGGLPAYLLELITDNVGIDLTATVVGTCVFTVYGNAQIIPGQNVKLEADPPLCQSAVPAILSGTNAAYPGAISTYDGGSRATNGVYQAQDQFPSMATLDLDVGLSESPCAGNDVCEVIWIPVPTVQPNGFPGMNVIRFKALQRLAVPLGYPSSRAPCFKGYKCG